MTGKIHSIQSLGTVDGPGVRYVIFLKGCNLRCHCCHNPDTWLFEGAREMTAEEIVASVKKYREYFGKNGGVTVSGGEPLLQAKFCRELFEMLKGEGINTCLDTSGSVYNKEVERLLSVTDRVLLDIKYTNNEDYLKYAGCTLDTVLEFLGKLKMPVTLRQVIIPTVNDTEDNILKLKEIKNRYPFADSVELLPFKNICQVKYDRLNIEFPFKNMPLPTRERMEELNEILKA